MVDALSLCVIVLLVLLFVAVVSIVELRLRNRILTDIVRIHTENAERRMDEANRAGGQG